MRTFINVVKTSQSYSRGSVVLEAHLLGSQLLRVATEIDFSLFATALAVEFGKVLSKHQIAFTDYSVAPHEFSTLLWYGWSSETGGADLLLRVSVELEDSGDMLLAESLLVLTLCEIGERTAVRGV